MAHTGGIPDKKHSIPDVPELLVQLNSILSGCVLHNNQLGRACDRIESPNTVRDVDRLKIGFKGAQLHNQDMMQALRAFNDIITLLANKLVKWNERCSELESSLSVPFAGIPKSERKNEIFSQLFDFSQFMGELLRASQFDMARDQIPIRLKDFSNPKEFKIITNRDDFSKVCEFNSCERRILSLLNERIKALKKMKSEFDVRLNKISQHISSLEPSTPETGSAHSRFFDDQNRQMRQTAAQDIKLNREEKGIEGFLEDPELFNEEKIRAAGANKLIEEDTTGFTYSRELNAGFSSMVKYNEKIHAILKALHSELNEFYVKNDKVLELQLRGLEDRAIQLPDSPAKRAKG